MPAVDAIQQLMYTMAEIAVQPFARYISVPQACRQLEGPKVTKPFAEINQFVPEVGSLVDIVPSHALPDVDKLKGDNVQLKMPYFKGYRFSLDDKDYSEISRLGSLAKPSVMLEMAEELALYINLSIFNDSINQGLDWVRTAGTPFSTEDKFNNNFVGGSLKLLLENHSPMRQHYIADSEAYTDLLKLGKIVAADTRGTSGPNTTGVVGEYVGTQFLPQPGIVKKDNTAWTSSAKPLIDLTAGYPIGATVIHTDTVLPKVGNLFAHNSVVHTVIALNNVASEDADLTIYPALTAAIANNAALTQYTPVPNLHIAPRSIAYASGIVRPAAPERGMAGSDGVRYAVRREPRSGVYLMLYRHVGYLQTIYTLCAWWGSVVDRRDGVIALG